MAMKAVILTSCLVFLLIPSVDSVTCYQCSSSSACADPFYGIFSSVGSCDGNYCTKTKSDVTGVIRGCTNVALWDGCKSVSGLAAQCFCSSILCNNAPATMVGRSGLQTMVVMVAMSLVAIVM